MASRTALDMSAVVWKEFRPFAKTLDGQASSRSLDAHALARNIASELISRFSAQRVILFGSLARGVMNRYSDIDLAVWGIPPEKFYRAVAFANGLSKEWKVDVVDGDDCSKAMQESILREGVEL